MPLIVLDTAKLVKLGNTLKNKHLDRVNAESGLNKDLINLAVAQSIAKTLQVIIDAGEPYDKTD